MTLLDRKGVVVRELIEEAERRGVKVELFLLDRAFFTVECIGLLKELRLWLVMPCVCNEIVRSAVDSFRREGTFPFSINDNSKNEATFTMVVYWSARRLVATMPKEYRRRWGIETAFKKVKEVYGMTLSPLYRR